MRKTSIPTGLFALSVLLVLGGCATILGGGSNQAVSFRSSPESATYTVLSSSGIQMGSGVTPGVLMLPRKNEYQIEISLEGYQTQTAVLTKGINGWIWGNLIIGWIVGFGIDFLTGSAYKLEPSMVQVTLTDVGQDKWAVVQLLDSSNRIIDEQRLLMIPEGQE